MILNRSPANHVYDRELGVPVVLILRCNLVNYAASVCKINAKVFLILVNLKRLRCNRNPQCHYLYSIVLIVKLSIEGSSPQENTSLNLVW